MAAKVGFFSGAYRSGRGADAEAIERAVDEEERRLAKDAAERAENAGVLRRGPPPPAAEPGAQESREAYSLRVERPALFDERGVPIGLAVKRFELAEAERRGAGKKKQPPETLFPRPIVSEDSPRLRDAARRRLLEVHFPRTLAKWSKRRLCRRCEREFAMGPSMGRWECL